MLILKDGCLTKIVDELEYCWNYEMRKLENVIISSENKNYKYLDPELIHVFITTKNI